MNQYIPIILLLLFSATASAGEWHVDKNAQNEVRFTSEVVVLSFDGVTDQIDGYLYWEGEKMFEKNSQLQFDVDLNTVETGIGKRDRDMRDVLATDKWPVTTFKGTISEYSKIDSSVTAYRVTSKGTIFIHGVERELEVPAIVVREGDQMHVTARFMVLLKDFDIEAPSLAAFVKVSQEIHLKVDFYLSEFTEE